MVRNLNKQWQRPKATLNMKERETDTPWLLSDSNVREYEAWLRTYKHYKACKDAGTTAAEKRFNKMWVYLAEHWKIILREELELTDNDVPSNDALEAHFKEFFYDDNEDETQTLRVKVLAAVRMTRMERPSTLQKVKGVLLMFRGQLQINLEKKGTPAPGENAEVAKQVFETIRKEKKLNPPVLRTFIHSRRKEIKKSATPWTTYWALLKGEASRQDTRMIEDKKYQDALVFDSEDEDAKKNHERDGFKGKGNFKKLRFSDRNEVVTGKTHWNIGKSGQSSGWSRKNSFRGRDERYQKPILNNITRKKDDGGVYLPDDPAEKRAAIEKYRKQGVSGFCYICGKFKHKADKCPKRKTKQTVVRPRSQDALASLLREIPTDDNDAMQGIMAVINSLKTGPARPKASDFFRQN
jgi:hypothetical protein